MSPRFRYIYTSVAHLRTTQTLHLDHTVAADPAVRHMQPTVKNSIVAHTAPPEVSGLQQSPNVPAASTEEPTQNAPSERTRFEVHELSAMCKQLR